MKKKKIFKTYEERIAYLDMMAENDANPPQRCTRYEFVNALKQFDMALYARLFGAYQQSMELQFMWNTVNDLDRRNEDFISMTQQLSIDGETLDELFRVVGRHRIDAKF